MSKANMDLRDYANEKGVEQWRIAKAFGVVDSTMCRWMREEFSEEKKAQYKDIVDRLAMAAKVKTGGR